MTLTDARDAGLMPDSLESFLPGGGKDWVATEVGKQQAERIAAGLDPDEAQEELPEFDAPPTERDLLAMMYGVLVDLKDALVAGAASGGNGTSSVTIEDMSRGRPKIITKRYSGSDPEIEQAVEDHRRAVELATQAWADDWTETVAALVAAKAKEKA